MKKIAKCALLLLSVLVMFSCSKKEGATTEGGAASSGKKKVKFAFVTNGASDFWLYAQAGLQKMAEESGDIEVIFKVGDGTTAKQKQIVDDLISSGVKGIAISPVDPKGQKRMINEWSKDIKVLCVDSDAPDSDRVAYLGTDNVAAGRQCGELVKEALPEGGDIMAFVGLADAQSAKERFQGLKEALKGTKINVLDLRTDGTKSSKARANAEDTLVRNAKIAGLVGLWSYNTPANLAAVKDAGKLDSVKVIGFDEDATTLKAIDEGHVHGTVVQNPYRFGYDSMKVLRGLIVEGKTLKELGIPDNKLSFVPTKSLRKGEGVAYKEYCDGLKASLRK